MSNHFSHAHGDDNTGTSHELTVTAAPACYLVFEIRVESPKAKSVSTFRLPRFRARALHHMIGAWLAATEGQDDR